MLRIERIIQRGVIGLLILILSLAFQTITVQAQNWQALPPYNVLWPLWSDVLSPVNPNTGVKTPLITELTIDTILPVQPALVWDPAQSTPWLMYNMPENFGSGLVYFNPYYGINLWPPSYLIDPLTNSPLPISLPGGYKALPPTDIAAFGPYFNTASTTYAIIYPPAQYGYSFYNFLTPADVWGLPPL